MINKANSLTEYARNGYMRNENSHIWSSPVWYAHKFGEYLHATGRTVPTDVRMGRGDSIRNGDTRYTFKHDKADRSRLAFERVQ